MVVDEETIGFPVKHLAEIPAGDYFVQGVFNVYETYHLASGKTVKLAPDRGEGQHWASKPGNFYSAPVKLHVNPAAGGILRLTLDKIIPPILPAYWGEKVPIASQRLPDGTIIGEMELDNRYEYVQGTHGRAGQQWDILQAVFSPAGPDGYPQPIYDKLTGTIDKQVAAYWHDHYDLNVILQRDWKTLGPKLEGKLHFIAGESDRYFQNNDVHLMENFFKTTRNPHSDATFDYGFRRGHEYTGAPDQSATAASGTQTQRLLPLMVEHFLQTAPPGVDVTSWRY